MENPFFFFFFFTLEKLSHTILKAPTNGKMRLEGGQRDQTLNYHHYYLMLPNFFLLFFCRFPVVSILTSQLIYSNIQVHVLIIGT